jgi:uncharacterized membrane protein
MLGLWLFVGHIVSLYVINALTGDFEAWNKRLPHGFEEGNVIGNVSLGLHLMFAAVISFLAPLQLIPSFRLKLPSVHKWMGRIYIIAALILALGGIHLSMSGREVVGDLSQHIAITINALIILVTAVLTFFHAFKRKFAIHKRWALRLFWAVNGVFMFRIGLMFWIMVNQKPRGIDMDSFSGLPLTIIAISVYLLPMLIVEAYLRVRDNKRVLQRMALALGFNLICVIACIGTVGAFFGIWWPSIKTLLS